jgi:hypothetical protein
MPRIAYPAKRILARLQPARGRQPGHARQPGFAAHAPANTAAGGAVWSRVPRIGDLAMTLADQASGDAQPRAVGRRASGPPRGLGARVALRDRLTADTDKERARLGVPGLCDFLLL